jgi:hypothetical protein
MSRSDEDKGLNTEEMKHRSVPGTGKRRFGGSGTFLNRQILSFRRPEAASIFVGLCIEEASV